MAVPVEDTFPPCNCPDWELFVDLNENQAGNSIVDNKPVQIEPCYSCIHNRMLCFDDKSTCTLAPSLVEFVKDDSSVDSLSTTGNITYLSTIEAYQTEVDQPCYNYHGPTIVLPKH